MIRIKELNRLWVFLIVLLSILVNSIYFNYSAFGRLVYLIDMDGAFIHMVKVVISLSLQLSISIFIAGFVFLFRKDLWVLIFGLISDLWLVSNHIYFKVNNLFLSVDAIALAGNLQDGMILKSVLPFLPGALFYPVVTILCYVAIIYVNNHCPCKPSCRSAKHFLLAICLSLLFYLPYPFKQWGIHYWRYQERDIYGKFGYRCFIPLYVVHGFYAVGGSTMGAAKWTQSYVSLTSIYHFFPAIFVYNSSRIQDSDVVVDKDEVMPFINIDGFTAGEHVVDSPLIILLVESLESWAINGSGQLEHVTDNLSRLSQSENVLYCTKLGSQVKHGVSGDGQLIVNTGLLPTMDKIVCQDYSTNFFPNCAGLFRQSFLVNSWSHTWNQDNITGKYGYKSLIQSSDGHYWNDEEVIDKTIEVLKNNREKSVCVMVVTSSTHIPFDAEERANLKFDGSAKNVQADYLNCLAYTDSCIGKLLDYIASDTLYSDAIIVVTGDHTIFKSGEINDVKRINGANVACVGKTSTYVPLIVYSPKIEGNIVVTDELYQMDIFPTIMNAIGAENYFWKGFGINIIDPTAERPASEDKAFDISDRIIRKDYLSEYASINKKK